MESFQLFSCDFSSNFFCDNESNIRSQIVRIISGGGTLSFAKSFSICVNVYIPSTPFHYIRRAKRTNGFINLNFFTKFSKRQCSCPMSVQKHCLIFLSSFHDMVPYLLCPRHISFYFRLSLSACIASTFACSVELNILVVNWLAGTDSWYQLNCL